MRISDWSSDVCSSDLPLTLCRDAVELRLEQGALRVQHFDIAGITLVVAPLGEPQRVLPGLDLVGFRREPLAGGLQIGRAACRERVCRYVSISVVPVVLKKKTNDTNIEMAR